MGQNQKTNIKNINSPLTHPRLPHLLQRRGQQDHLPRIQEIIIRPWALTLLQPLSRNLRGGVHNIRVSLRPIEAGVVNKEEDKVLEVKTVKIG